MYCIEDRATTTLNTYEKFRIGLVWTSFLGDRFQNVRPILSDRCLSVSLSVCLTVCNIGVGLLWPNGWMDQDATLYGCLGLGDIVSDGDQFPHGNEHSSPPPTLADVYCGQTVAHLSNC